jgi:hypothetical protein
MTNVVSIAQSGANNVTMRNKIINGAMVIDQRNAGAAVTGVAGQYAYPVDRFKFYNAASSKLSGQQSTVTPSGFTNSVLITSLAATTPAAGDEYQLYHQIEGFNAADLGFGTASAQSITLSFWVRSSLTGTFAGALNNAGGTRSYVFTYAISAANAWEQKTITIAGDTSGTWATGNQIGIQVLWDLGSGSNFVAVAGSWVSAFDCRTSGSVSLVGTNGATFYITGVQLEKGTAATPFEQRLYGTELALCQRYFYSIRGNSSPNVGFMPATWDNSAGAYGPILFPVSMRDTPASITVSSASHFTVVREGIAWETGTALALSIASSTSAVIFIGTATRDTRGFSTRIATNSVSAFLGFNAEL